MEVGHHHHALLMSFQRYLAQLLFATEWWTRKDHDLIQQCSYGSAFCVGMSNQHSSASEKLRSVALIKCPDLPYLFIYLIYTLPFWEVDQGYVTSSPMLPLQHYYGSWAGIAVFLRKISREVSHVLCLSQYAIIEFEMLPRMGEKPCQICRFHYC